MGITFDKEKQLFVFDFEHDGADDIVSLTGSGYQVEAFDAIHLESVDGFTCLSC